MLSARAPAAATVLVVMGPPVSKAQARPASRAEDPPASRAEDHPVSKAEDHPASKAEDHPASKAEDHPASKAEDHPGTTAVALLDFRAAARLLSEAEDRPVITQEGLLAIATSTRRLTTLPRPRQDTPPHPLPRALQLRPRPPLRPPPDRRRARGSATVEAAL